MRDDLGEAGESLILQGFVGGRVALQMTRGQLSRE